MQNNCFVRFAQYAKTNTKRYAKYYAEYVKSMHNIILILDNMRNIQKKLQDYLCQYLQKYA